MKNITKLFIVLFVWCHTVSFAQTVHYFKYTNPVVKINSAPIKNPWAGGLNSNIFNTIDLNGDGIKDLFLWEHQEGAQYPTSYKMRTFINNGTPNQVDYSYAPQYEVCFPQNLHHWVLLVDYDCDGREDLFSYAYAGGMEVYHNDYNAGSGLSFSLAYSLLYSLYLGNQPANLYVSNVNQPALIDVNGDGDLDVLTFSILGGSIEYHENMAQELFSRCDTLVFHQIRQTWGAIGMNWWKNSATLNYSHLLTGNISTEKSQLHNGSCLLGYDESGDGDIDLINGDLLGDSLLFLENTPNLSSPLYWTDSITSQDSSFPVYNTSANYATFPTAYILDANNDGRNDMVVSSCIELPSENYENNWLYENIGNNSNHNFSFLKNRFLTDEMIDVGAGSNVTFFDADADGLKDLIIGNYGYLVTNSGPNHQESSLMFLKNTTVGNVPSFSQVSTNYSSLQQYNLRGIKPTFGDLDNDGDDDMIIGNSEGNLYFFQNNAGPGNPSSFSIAVNGINYAGIDVGYNSAPQLVDVNNDGLLDLLIGETFGNIWYYQNVGSLTVPAFNYVTNNFGGVNVVTSGQIYGFSVPHMYLENGVHKLMVGSENGYLYLYDNIDGNLAGTFNLVDNTAFDVYEPYRAAADMEDLTGDGSPEIIVGNYAGGLSFYSTGLTGFESIVAPAEDFLVYPNPASDKIVIEFKNRQSQPRTIEVFDVPGKLIKSISSNQYKEVINVNTLGKGVYFVKIKEENNIVTKKIIVK